MKPGEIALHVFASAFLGMIFLAIINFIFKGDIGLLDYICVFCLTGSVRIIFIIIMGDYKG